MFCSKCGKTLKPEANNCPFCGAVVGDSRFEGNGYTSAQPRFSSGEEVRPVTPYTRITYTSMQEEGEAPSDDVYTRTTYRPLLSDEEDISKQDEPQSPAQEPVQNALPVYGDEFDDDDEEEFEQEEPDAQYIPEDDTQEDVSEPAPKPAPKPVQSPRQPIQFAQSSHRRYTAEGEGIFIAPPKPIQKTGISPEVQQYMQRMSGQRPEKHSFKQLFNKITGADANEQKAAETVLPDGVTDASGASVEEDGVIAADAQAHEGAEASAPRRVQQTKPQAITHKLPSWIRPLAVTLCILVILGAAGYALLLKFAHSSPVAGVSYELYDQGIKLIKEHQDTPYRTEMVKLVQADPSTSTLVSKLATDKAQIQALMPAQPLENDQLFVDTLVSIQATIEKAVGAEALAILTKTDDTAAKAAWAEVENATTRLVNATEARELEGIKGDAEVILATPAPSETPAPAQAQYKTLKNGMKNSSAVKKMQKRLNQLGFFKGTEFDGDFGPVTVTAVKQFKQVAGITPVDGVADVAMQEALFAEDAPRAPSKATPKPTTTPVPIAGANAAANEADVTAPEDNEPVVAE